METIIPAYKAVSNYRYGETSGLYCEYSEPGDVLEHRPGRTVTSIASAADHDPKSSQTGLALLFRRCADAG